MIYDKAQESDHLYGISHSGEWFHIGTPETLEEARQLLENGDNDFSRP